MTVAPLTKKTGTHKAPRLTCVWVPVRGQDGRTRMEMRWVDATHRSTRSAA